METNVKQSENLFYFYQDGETPNEEAIKEQLRFFKSIHMDLDNELYLKNALPTFTQFKMIHKLIGFMVERKCLVNLIEIWKIENGDEIMTLCSEYCKILEEFFPETSEKFEKKFASIILNKNK